MPTLFDDRARADILKRLDRLEPDGDRRWGRMTCGGMVCHLSDSFLACMGEAGERDASSWVSRTAIRILALSTPMPWPKGVRTLPELDQERDGTPPAEFDADRERLRDLAERFVRECDPARYRHPLFGRLTRGEWGRWAWRHMDHHLRQFGV